MNTSVFSADEWQRICDLYDELSLLPPDERKLDNLKDTDVVVDMVTRMLQVRDCKDPRLLDQTFQVLAGEIFSNNAPTRQATNYSGRTLGPWRALEEIGRGGMAVVLRGTRADGRFEKEVAIKLLPPASHEMAREQLIEEIRILARLEHPNIARLIDGGIDEEKIPYLVMELVHGLPITDHAERLSLDIEARIDLFHQVLDAVNFAHRQLIIHCDIKPGNILVTDDDQVKLVDFGIATLVNATSERKPDSGNLLCSPGYCAPEQFRGASPATSLDIYNLGAVLYELLCRHRIRSGDTITRLFFDRDSADHAILAPSKFNSEVDRDLDAICLKAMAHDPDDRYENVALLQTDLRRWSTHRPVSARAGGRGYRASKWIRRHLLPATALSAIALALIFGSAIALWQAREARMSQITAESELKRANVLNEFVTGLFENARHGQPRESVPTTRELLLRGAEMAKTEFDGQPELQQDMLILIGELLLNVGMTDESRKITAEAIEQHQSRNAGSSHDLGSLRLLHGQALHYLDKLDLAIDELRRATTALRGTGDSIMLAEALHALGFAASGRFLWDEAIDAHLEALEIERQSSDAAALGSGLSSTARTFQRAGRLEESEAYYKEALSVMRSRSRGEHYQLATALTDYGVLLRRQSKLEQAESVLREAIALSENIFTGPHLLMAQRLNNLGTVLASQGKRVEAIDAFAESLTIQEAFPESDNATVRAGPLNNLGFLNMSIGRLDQAETYLRGSISLIESSVGQDHPFHIAVATNLGRCLMLQQAYTEAESVLTSSLERARAHYGESDLRVSSLLSILGQLKWQRDHDPQGLAMIQDAYEATRENPGPDDPATARIAIELAEALAQQPNPSTARALYEQALAISVEQFAPLHHQILKARIGLAELMLATGDSAAAQEVLAPIGPTPPNELAASDPLRHRLMVLSEQLQTH